MIGPAEHFDDAARAATIRQRDRLHAIERIVTALMPVALPRCTFICSGYAEPSAETFSSHGVVFLAERLLSDAPAKIIETVAVHEAVHLIIRAELRDSVEGRIPDPYKLLHDRLINDWVSGRIQFSCDRNYVTAKGWRILYDGWLGPLDIEQLKAADAAAAYFDALRRGHVSFSAKEIFAAPPRAYASGPNAWEGPLGAEYEKSPGDVAVMAATGFELVDYFHTCLARAAEQRSGIDLWLIEEGFANFVSMSLTGLALDELQRWAPQDRSKLEVTRRISQLGITVEDVLANTASARGMIEYIRALRIAGPS